MSFVLSLAISYSRWILQCTTFRWYQIVGAISIVRFAFFVKAWKHNEINHEILSEYLANRHPCRHFRRHAVIASRIYAYYIRCDKTWLLECLVHCSASAGVDWVSRSFDCKFARFLWPFCSTTYCLSLPKMVKLILDFIFYTSRTVHTSLMCNTYAVLGTHRTHLHGIFLIYDESLSFLPYSHFWQRKKSRDREH